MTADELEFERILGLFGEDASLPQRYLRADLRLNDSALTSADILRALNRDAEFWAIASHALHVATFISLHRLFDHGSEGSADRVLRFAGQHVAIFSVAALRERQRQRPTVPAANPPHETRPADLRKLRQEFRRWESIYNARYRPIRTKVIAHKIFVGSSAGDRYADTLIVELHEMCTYLPALHDALSRLYLYGVAPAVEYRALTLEEIRAGVTANEGQRAVVRHADRALASLIGAQRV
jgi:hypothetical protein